jgi:hypothetical protein
MKIGLAAACVSLFSALAGAQTTTTDEAPRILLDVPSGAPLRVYLTKRISKRLGAPVEAKLLAPVFAFDREVIPAGTVVQGEVSHVQPYGKWERARAILNGDFTPLRRAEVAFSTLILGDGRKVPMQTMETLGLNSIYTEPSKKTKVQKPRPQDQNGGILGTAKQTAKDKWNQTMNRGREMLATVRGPNKKEKLIDFLWTKLPYHPQYVRRGTRFDAVLREPLRFGFEPVQPAELAELGSQPHPDSVVQVRLLTPLDSGSAKQGEAVLAVVTAPLFSPDHKLVLPEGTRLTGTVAMAKRARSFHRAGQLRFNFQKLDLPPEVANLRLAVPPAGSVNTQATLLAAEASGTAPIKVDPEGGVKAQESKTRFIAPVISAVLASRAADNERHYDHDGDANDITGKANSNISGRTLGGGLGFGLLGSAIAQSSKYVGMAFGYYGLAWSVYSNVIARGAEVEFPKNAMMDITFGARTPPKGSKFRAVMQQSAGL